MAEPIYVRCEGSGTPNKGYCLMCAASFMADPIPPHDRLDVIAMIERGDFDA